MSKLVHVHKWKKTEFVPDSYYKSICTTCGLLSYLSAPTPIAPEVEE